ncbi:hypothetical protein GDO86_011471 [Hymenochirus boettgeri]|uniref:SUZ domain-containing protein n=1 Tax=Hymenochirus boettgeri TaxID=247094 RepID=A0A8T2JH93_9PIPI|nr:hypothetical protein GDO86_011471 [Hymenochirus boettgeri]
MFYFAGRPEQRFFEHLKDEKSEESQKRFILKRDNSSIDKEENQQNRIHPFRDDRRSKSIEEREEEYQKVRERIFAQDSVFSTENLFMEIRIAEETNVCNNIHRKRQLFSGNRDGSEKTIGSRQSSAENDLKWAGERPWSSTDSDISNRNLKPSIIKTASLGGITMLTRGDSSGSSRSTGELSKTGSESSSSAGSSGSLSRLQPSLQSVPIVSATSVSTAGNMSYSENGIASSNTSYILLPFEAAGIPPASIILNPHTGHPFVNTDGTPAIYNPFNGQQSLRAQIIGPVQHQAALHQPQAQQKMQGQLMTQREDIATHFNQINLSRQSSGETPEPVPAPVFSSAIIAEQTQPTNFVLSSSSQQMPPGSYTSTGQSVTQLLQPTPPQGLAQSPSQMSVYYFPSGQYPTSANQQYRPVGSVQLNAQRNPQMPPAIQQAGYQSVLSAQKHGFQGLTGLQQSTLNQNLLNSQQGSQMQGMMVQYPSMSSYQVPVSQQSQGIQQATYQQTATLPNLPNQGLITPTGMSVYCNVIPPTPQNSLRVIVPHSSSNVPALSTNCRTNCSGTDSSGWQIKY